MQMSSEGGSSETLAKALTVMPRGSPSRKLVTTVTPVATWRIAFRKAASAVIRRRAPMAVPAPSGRIVASSAGCERK